jgi:hypothetical protein
MQSSNQSAPSLQNRSLGLGFGKNNHFYVRLGEPNKIMINELPFPSEIIADIQQTVEAAIRKAIQNKGKKSSGAVDNIAFPTIFENVLKKYYKEEVVSNMLPYTLALIIPDILVDVNITRLNEHILPEAMKDTALKNVLGAGLNRFFLFDTDGNLDFSIGVGKNAAPIYKSDSYFSYDAMQDEQSDVVREEAQISQRFLKSLIVSKYVKDFGFPAEIKEIEKQIQKIRNDSNLSTEIIEQKIKEYEIKIDDWKNQIVKDQLAVIFYDLTGKKPAGINLNNINPKINLKDNDIYAYLVPAIMDRLSDEQLKQVSTRIASHLAITDFKPLSSEKYEKLQLKLPPQEANITNANQRSLQFFTKPNGEEENDSGLDFRGKKYQFQHTHIHFEKDGEEQEFVVKGKDGKTINFDGEVHSVFDYTPPEKEGKTNRQKRLIAVHYPLKVDKGGSTDNPNVQELLDDVDANKQKWQEEINKWAHRENKNDGTPKPRLNLVKLLDFGKVFLNSMNEQSEKGQLLHFPWASWRSGTHGFRSGLRFIVSTQPIHVSETQYNKLKEIFGQMRNDLKEEEILDPIDRKAGWRKERIELTKELSHLMKETPQFRAR